MSDTASGASLAFKELTKDPIVYAFTLVLVVGCWLIKDKSTIDATWVVGICLIILGAVCLILKLCLSIFDNNFKSKYTELIATQSRTLRAQERVIKNLSSGTIEAHKTMVSKDGKTIAGGYDRPGSSATPTS